MNGVNRDLGSIRTDDRPFRFLHAADLHLGASEHVQAAFENLVAVAVERSVDAVMLAGDVYDAADRSPNLQMRFLRALRALDDAGIHVFIAHGNHDPLAGSFRPVVGEFPGNVHIFAPGDPQTYLLQVGSGTVAVTGLSFANAHDKSNLAERIAATAVDADLRIAVLHANVAGQPGHDDYGPCTQNDLRDSDIDYWALGHIHKRTVTPMGHGRWWVYPGNLQGRSTKPAECGPKGVVIVTAGDIGFDEPEFVACDVHRFARLWVDLSGVEHFEDAVERVTGRLTETLDAQSADDGTGRGLTARVELHGATGVHDELHALTPEFLAEHLDDPRIEVQRIRNATRRLVDRAALARSDSLVGNVLRRIDHLREDPPALETLLEQVKDLAGPDAQRRIGDLLAKGQIEVADLLARVDDLVLGELAGSDQ